MTRLYRLGYCGVSLQEAGYRLRPASEVIRSAYGTLAELVNLDVTLQQAAGLEAEVAVCALHPSTMDNQGLATIVSLVAQSKLMPEKVALTGTQEACLQPFLTLTNLEGKPLIMEAYLGAKEVRQIDTLKVDEKKWRQLQKDGGWLLCQTRHRSARFMRMPPIRQFLKIFFCRERWIVRWKHLFICLKG